MVLDRLSPKTKAGLAVALALLMWLPQGISTDTTPVVTGHSTFYYGDVYDQCLASIAGILRSRVLWFNDQVLVERYPGKGTFLFVTENGAPDPSEQQYLVSEGITYNFKDPNGAEWVIEEAYYEPSVTTARPPTVSANQQSVDLVYNRTYVWFVELSATPVVDQFPGDQYPHSLYNFLVLVDTCKFHNMTDVTYKGYTRHEDNLDDRHGHENDATPHAHQVWQADLWVGKRPLVMPASEVPGQEVSETGWASFENSPHENRNEPDA